MAYKPATGETEFGGVAGMYPDQMTLAPTLQQQMWATYATNEGGAVTADNEDTASEEWGRLHIGEPRRSFSIPGASPSLAGNVGTTWPPEEDE